MSKRKEKIVQEAPAIDEKPIQWREFLLHCQLMSIELSKTQPQNNIAKLVHPVPPQPFIVLPTHYKVPNLVQVAEGKQQIILKDGQTRSLNLSVDK